VSIPHNPSYRATEKVIARWEDSQYSLTSFGPRARIPSRLSCLISDWTLSWGFDCRIRTAYQQEAPQKEAARVKKETVDLEGDRQKNIRTLRP